MRLLLDHAAENGYGIPAFNVNNMEQIQAIMQAAAATDSPVILQASRGARKYAGENFLRHLITAAVETYPHIPIVMHQDHGNEPATCYSAIRNGFTSVMMDGSLEADAKTPATYEYNVNVTAEVVKVAHSIGASVEGELGCLKEKEKKKVETTVKKSDLKDLYDSEESENEQNSSKNKDKKSDDNKKIEKKKIVTTSNQKKPIETNSKDTKPVVKKPEKSDKVVVKTSSNISNNKSSD